MVKRDLTRYMYKTTKDFFLSNQMVLELHSVYVSMIAFPFYLSSLTLSFDLTTQSSALLLLTPMRITTTHITMNILYILYHSQYQCFCLIIFVLLLRFLQTYDHCVCDVNFSVILAQWTQGKNECSPTGCKWLLDSLILEVQKASISWIHTGSLVHRTGAWKLKVLPFFLLLNMLGTTSKPGERSTLLGWCSTKRSLRYDGGMLRISDERPIWQKYALSF